MCADVHGNEYETSAQAQRAQPPVAAFQGDAGRDRESAAATLVPAENLRRISSGGRDAHADQHSRTQAAVAVTGAHQGLHRRHHGGFGQRTQLCRTAAPVQHLTYQP